MIIVITIVITICDRIPNMNLLNSIKNNENIRRLFGKRELKIIEKQLRGVRLEPSERVRLSRDIRKKFEAIKELSEYKEEFGLKRSEEKKRIISETLERIKQTELFPSIKRIILFGSTAENEQTLMSDIDIAVDFDKIDEKTALTFRSRIGGIFSKKLDLQVYNMLPEKIKKQIDENGKLLYKRK